MVKYNFFLGKIDLMNLVVRTTKFKVQIQEQQLVLQFQTMIFRVKQE